MAKILRKFLADYDKHVDFERLVSGYMDAVERARRLDEMANEEGDNGRNPTTGVWRLTESIRGDEGGEEQGTGSTR